MSDVDALYRLSAPGIEVVIEVPPSCSVNAVVAGGLSVTSATGRRIRWDLYVVSP